WQAGTFYQHWSLWILFSLFCGHMLLYWSKKFPRVIGVTIALQIGLIFGYFDEIGHTFSLSRTFIFFPFFLVVACLTKEQVMHVKKKAVKIPAVIIMALVAIGIYVAPDFNSGWLLASKSYGTLGLTEYGGFARLLVYVTSTLMAISVFAWIPT